MAQNALKSEKPSQLPPDVMATAISETPNKSEKKPKLSKAEKKRLNILAAIQLKKQLILDQLRREIALADKSERRGRQQWEEMCRTIAEKDLREEIEEWSTKINVLIEKKDEKIKKLVETVEETHGLHEQALSAHIEQLDYLTNCHKVLRQTATDVFEMQATDMLTDFFMQMDRIRESYERENLNQENVMQATTILFKNRVLQNHEKYTKTRFSEVCTEIERRYATRDATVNNMAGLQETLLHWMKALQGDLLDARKSEKFMHFMQRQRNYVKESKKLNEVERSTTKTMMDLEQELLSIEADTNKTIYGLKLQQAYFFSVRDTIKTGIERNKAATHEKLRGVAGESYELVKKLHEFVRSGELLLGLAACCRKYETEREKVAPWKINPQDCVIDPEFVLQLKVDIMKCLDLSEDDMIEQMTFLKNFWLRCSNVEFHNLLLREEKRKLEEENERYRSVIRSMKKSDDVEYILESMEIKQV